MFSGVWGDRGRCRVHRREDAGGNDIVSACHIWNIQEKKKWNDAADADDTQRLGKKKSGGGLNKMDGPAETTAAGSSDVTVSWNTSLCGRSEALRNLTSHLSQMDGK